MHEQEHKQFSTFHRYIQALLCFKYRQMAFKEDPGKKVIHTVHFLEKKLDFMSKIVDIHLIYVKKV